ncbi:MAG: acyltransferase [Candidatus Auribacterota bacterium]|nr:acyltransferase [Candidatus Auribacterota bacterium]
MTDKSVYIYPNAIVETEDIGEHTRIWAFVHILKGANIGSNCNICEHCFIENDVKIGNNVTVKSGVYIWNGVRVEDNVFLGPNVTFTNDIYPRSKVYEKNYPQTFLKKGASIGAGSVLIAGITIGRYAMIGGGSVVTKDIKDYELVYGNPARHHGYICECKEKVNFKGDKVLKCSCGLSYVCKEGIVSRV